jgi:hypothetical protein
MWIIELFKNSGTWEFFLWGSLAYGEIPSTPTSIQSKK